MKLSLKNFAKKSPANPSSEKNQNNNQLLANSFDQTAPNTEKLDSLEDDFFNEEQVVKVRNARIETGILKRRIAEKIQKLGTAS